MTILYEKPDHDRWAGTKFAASPMPPDSEIIAAIQRVYSREGGGLRRVAWDLGDLNVEDLQQWVLSRRVLWEAHRKAMGVIE